MSVSAFPPRAWWTGQVSNLQLRSQMRTASPCSLTLPAPSSETRAFPTVLAAILGEEPEPLCGGRGKTWCERGESNPHGFPRQILSLVRLPIPPLSQARCNEAFLRAGNDSSVADFRAGSFHQPPGRPSPGTQALTKGGKKQPQAGGQKKSGFLGNRKQGCENCKHPGAMTTRGTAHGGSRQRPGGQLAGTVSPMLLPMLKKNASG